MSVKRSEIPAGLAPAVVVAHSFNSALYHQLMIHVRRFRLSGKIERPAWDQAIRRVARIYLPLGPFHWFEYAIAGAADNASLRTALDDRAAHFARELGEAMASVADDYRCNNWAIDRPELERVQHELVAAIGTVKDALFTELGRQLELGLGSEPLEFMLVPHCHEPTGAYSHPTVIGIDRFAGHSLIEVLLHEAGHVAAARSAEGQPDGLERIQGAAARLGLSEGVALELFHLLLFHAAGALVRACFDMNFATVASRLNVYAKIGAKVGFRGLSEADIDAIWGRRQRGETGLDEVVQQIHACLKKGGASKPITA